MFKKSKRSRITAVIVGVLVLMGSGITSVVAERSSSQNANPGSMARTFIDVDCTANPDALLQPPYSMKFLLNTTFNITGACNGPLYITADGIRLVGVDESAAIVLPGPPTITDPSNGAVFGDGAHDLRIQNLLIDVTAWGTGLIANGTDAAGIYARNAFVRVIDTRIEGGLFSINPFRNAIVRTQGLVELIDFVSAGLSVGDQSLITTRGPVNMSSTVTDGNYMNAVEVYRSGVMDFRRGVTINLPPEDESTGFKPNAISVYRQSHLRIRNNGPIDIQGGVFLDIGATANIDGGNFNGEMIILENSALSIRNASHAGLIFLNKAATVNIDGGNFNGEMKLYENSALTIRNAPHVGQITIGMSSVVNLLDGVNQTGGISVDTASHLQINDSFQSGGNIHLAMNSSARIFDSTVDFLEAYIGAVFDVGLGQIGGAHISNRSFVSLNDVSTTGNIQVFGPSSINYFGDASSLNGNTIFLCGTTESNIDLGIGTVSDLCGP